MRLITDGLGLFAILAIGIALLAIWTWTLLDIIRNSSLTSEGKLLWILFVIFFPFLGSLLYLIVGRSAKIKR